ncbi:MAG: sigma-70 family RNA polymerase sigma factor [Bacteroidota bacterium]
MSDRKNMTDNELVEGCVKNDRYAQELLFRKYFSSMMRMCMRYTDDREQAMEIVNSGFLRVFKKIHTFAFKGSLEGWIRKLVYHSLSEHFKKHSRYLQFLVFEERDQSLESNQMDNLYAEDILKLVDTLPPATQKVFRLYAIDGFTHVEIAKMIDISIGTSKWHLANARKKLKQLITQRNNMRLYVG